MGILNRSGRTVEIPAHRNHPDPQDVPRIGAEVTDNKHDISAPFFTNGIEVTHYSDLDIINFDGTGAPGNNSAYPVLLINGSGFRTNLDKKSVVIK